MMSMNRRKATISLVPQRVCPDATQLPQPCQGHSTTHLTSYHDDGNEEQRQQTTDSLIVFGGRLNNPRTSAKQRKRGVRTYTNHMYRYSIADRAWRRIVPRNVNEADVPSPRHNHSAVMVNGADDSGDVSGLNRVRMIIYGGSGVDGYLDDVYCFDFESNVWEKWECSGADDEKPGARHGHTACLLNNDQMIVFGGKVGVQSTVFYNDVHVLDLKSRKWSRLFAQDNTMLTTPDTTVVPPPRCWHTANMLTEQEMMIFGGFRFDGRREIYFDDTWVFHVVGRTWQQIEPKTADQPVPHIRNRHSCTLLGDHLLMFGGNYLEFGTDVFLGDVWLLSLHDRQWVECAIQGAHADEFPVFQRGHHTATCVNSVIYIFGGEESMVRHNDMHTIAFSSDE